MIPHGMTEDEVVQTINLIANRLAGKFKFGYHELEDMKQQARLFAWEGLENYDGVRPLENFLGLTFETAYTTSSVTISDALINPVTPVPSLICHLAIVIAIHAKLMIMSKNVTSMPVG